MTDRNKPNEELDTLYQRRKQQNLAPNKMRTSIFRESESRTKRSYQQKTLSQLTRYFRFSAAMGAMAMAFYVVFFQLTQLGGQAPIPLYMERLDISTIVKIHSVEGEKLDSAEYAQSVEFTEYRESFLAQQSAIVNTVGANELSMGDVLELKILDNHQGLALGNCENEVILITQNLLQQLGISSESLVESRLANEKQDLQRNHTQEMRLANHLAVGSTISLQLDEQGRIVFIDTTSSNGMTCS